MIDRGFFFFNPPGAKKCVEKCSIDLKFGKKYFLACFSQKLDISILNMCNYVSTFCTRIKPAVLGIFFILNPKRIQDELQIVSKMCRIFLTYFIKKVLERALNTFCYALFLDEYTKNRTLRANNFTHRRNT